MNLVFPYLFCSPRLLCCKNSSDIETVSRLFMSVILRALKKLFAIRVSVTLLFRLFQNIRLHLRKLKMVIELAGNFNLSQWEVLPFTRCILHLKSLRFEDFIAAFDDSFFWRLFFFKLLTFRSKNFKVYLKTSIVSPAYLTLKKKKHNYCLDILKFCVCIGVKRKTNCIGYKI